MKAALYDVQSSSEEWANLQFHYNRS